MRATIHGVSVIGPGAPSGWRGRLRVLRMDLTPLRRYRDFRLLFSASVISLFGSLVTEGAAPLQMKQLTNSYVAVGLIGIAEFVPLMVCGLWGGAIADAHDRRRVVLVATCVELLMSATLMANALLSHPQVWVIYAAAAGAAAATAMRRPSQDAMEARLVPYEDQPAANALSGLEFNGSAILAPAIGGVLAAYSMPLAYGVDVMTFVVALLLLVRVAPVPPGAAAERVSLAGIRAGVRYAAGRTELLGTYFVDIVAMAFAMPEALFPFLADQLGHPQALGLLYSAGAVGAIVTTLTSGWTSRVHRHGLAIVLAGGGWGLGMACAGVAPNLWTVLCCLAFAGGADMLSGVFRGTVWNQTIPDELRGRLAGIELLSYSSGPAVGNARAGLMAQAGGVRFSIGVGGLLCMGGVAVTALLMPSFLRYDDRTDPHALQQRARRAQSDVPPRNLSP